MVKEFIYKASDNKSIDFSALDNSKSFVVTDLTTKEILVGFINFGDVCTLEFQNIVIADETIDFYKNQIVNFDAKKVCGESVWDCKYLCFECKDVVNAVDIFCDACDVLTDVKISVLK